MLQNPLDLWEMLVMFVLLKGNIENIGGTLLYALSMLVLHRELYLQPFGLRTYSQAFAGSKLRPQKEQFEF